MFGFADAAPNEEKLQLMESGKPDIKRNISGSTTLELIK